MKIANVEVGEEYAVGGPRSDWLRRVKITEVGQFAKERRGNERLRVKGEVGSGNHTYQDVFDGQEIRMTWAEHQEQKAQKKKERQKNAAERKKRREDKIRQRAKLAKRLEKLGEELMEDWHGNLTTKEIRMEVSYRGSDTVKMSFDKLAALLEKAGV